MKGPLPGRQTERTGDLSVGHAHDRSLLSVLSPLKMS